MLRVTRACRLSEQPEEARWLVSGLWAEQAVGIVGGEPKCCKSFLALDLAVSVASGTPALGRFPIGKPGRVILYAAEDALTVVRHRLEGIARSRQLDFASLDVGVITEPVVRLDLERDRLALRETIERWRPRLLVLDPFVRLHRIDENAVAEVAPLLAYLRELQRSFGAAVLLVHHARKGASHVRAGQALRGSSELHAWGDSNLYLARKATALTLTIEHRAAASPAPLALELAGASDAVTLRIVEPPSKPSEPRSIPIEERVTEALKAAGRPLSIRQLRAACQVRTASLTGTLAALTKQGAIERTSAGYCIRTQPELPSMTASLT